MRQLRLKREDGKYVFLYQGNIPEATIEHIRRYLDTEAEKIKEHSFLEKPLLWEDGNICYKVGYVQCEKESVVSLPERGSVLIAGSKGGFFVAAEYENRKIG